MIEEHDCIYKASERELELQEYYKSYGVLKDRIPYYESINRRNLGGKKGGKASVYGRPSPNRKLQPHQVDYIKNKYKLGNTTHRKLAKEMNVSPSVIQNVLNGKHYNKRKY